MTIVGFLGTSLVTLLEQCHEIQRRLFFPQNMDIVSSNLWTGNLVNFRTLEVSRNNKVKTETLKMEMVKNMVFRFIEIHYIRKRFYTTNVGYPPFMKHRQYYRDQLSEVV